MQPTPSPSTQRFGTVRNRLGGDRGRYGADQGTEPMDADTAFSLVQILVNGLQGDEQEKFISYLTTLLDQSQIDGSQIGNGNAGTNGAGGTTNFTGADTNTSWRRRSGARDGESPNPTGFINNARANVAGRLGAPGGDRQRPAQDRGLSSRSFFDRFPDAGKITVMG